MSYVGGHELMNDEYVMKDVNFVISKMKELTTKIHIYINTIDGNEKIDDIIDSYITDEFYKKIFIVAIDCINTLALNCCISGIGKDEIEIISSFEERIGVRPPFKICDNNEFINDIINNMIDILNIIKENHQELLLFNIMVNNYGFPGEDNFDYINGNIFMISKISLVIKDIYDKINEQSKILFGEGL